MNTADLKARILQELAETKIRLEGRETYQRLKEKWDSFTSTQKNISLVSGALFVLLILVTPIFSSYSESQNLISEFETKKELIRTLMLTQKDLSEMIGPSGATTVDSLRTRIQAEVLQDGLLPEQINGIQDFTDYKGSTLFPEQIIEAGLEISLKQITIKQLVQIATRLESLSQQVKIRDLILRADNENKGYLNANIKLLVLKLSDPSILSSPQPPAPPTRGRR